MKFSEFLNESTGDKSTSDDSLTPKQRRAVKLYNSMDIDEIHGSSSPEVKKVKEFYLKNIKIGDTKYQLHSVAAAKYLSKIINALIELIPASHSRSASMGGNFSSVRNAGIEISFDDRYSSSRYSSTLLAVHVEIGGALPYVIRKAAALFLKDVFSNITSISDEFEGRLFTGDGSAFDTVGFAYPGHEYYRNGAYKQITLKHNYLKMPAS